MSIQVGPSQPEDIPALKALWQQAFGDDDACIDAFFRSLYRPDQVLTVHEDGRLVSMACWLQETVCQGGRGWPAAYLYAVATDRAARGRGYCGRLLAFAEEFLAPYGIRALLLVPGEPSLRRFYGRLGYRDFSRVAQLELDAAPAGGTAARVAAPVYLELREGLLSDRAYVSCPVPVLAFQEAVARLYGGGLFRLEADGMEGCACAALDGAGRAVVYELLWPGDPAQGASLAAAAVGAQRTLVRTPGGETPFAMAKWLTPPPALSPVYLGIALD